MKKIVLGFIHRIVYASLLSLVAWTACTWPYSDSLSQRRIVISICYATNFPTAIVGRVTAPYRGVDVLFDTGGEWCDFCSREREFWYHMCFAVPVYVLLFYALTGVASLFSRWKRGRRRIAEQKSALPM